MSPIARSRTCLGLVLLLLAVSCARAPAPTPGVSRTLAEARARTIHDVRYVLRFNIPADPSKRLTGLETITMRLDRGARPLILDFSAPEGSVRLVRVNGEPADVEIVPDHVVVPGAGLHTGENLVEVQFDAGDLALNRNADFLYTLFVPDRASSAFPSFDQPDIKARYRLTLETPEDWQAVANGADVSRDTTAEGRLVWTFGETEPLSTYQFAFAAGRFQIETAERDGRTLRMFHRETDSAKVMRNREAIFDLHAAALRWLEAYTGIPYPFGKFDFVLIPSFQYGGMEHPGAILYQASTLLLDESATQNEYLGRASVISHETAHMWFGNLVTMRWFNDVWMKEVFANFMAAKIVNPSFPEINHELRFFLAHYPQAYAVDRTEGANPIRQRLDNLRNAGTLYGAIIYQKAPIVMHQLERLMGEEPFRDGLREYLDAHRFGNASWTDLIHVLDPRTPEDLAVWSHAWVEEPGRPTVRTTATWAAQRLRLTVTQTDPRGRDLRWTESVGLLAGWPGGSAETEARSEGPAVTVELNDVQAPSYVLAGHRGIGYGLLLLDSASRRYLLDSLPAIADPMARAVAWVTLWDAMLERDVRPGALVDLALRAMPRETEEQNLQRILGYLYGAYWTFLTPEERRAAAPRVEATLWGGLEQAAGTSLKAAYFNAYVSDALTPDAAATIEALWRGTRRIEGLPLAERQFTAMARALALRQVEGWQAILTEQRSRITNPDRRARFDFVRPALAADTLVRDRFFSTLADPANREHEPWVLEALRDLHHPLRSVQAEKYIEPSLGLLEDIQVTGDIFFPGRWLGATLGGHQRPEAAAIVRRFLADHPDYPPELRAKVLQEADPLFRASAILEGVQHADSARAGGG